MQHNDSDSDYDELVEMYTEKRFKDLMFDIDPDGFDIDFVEYEVGLYLYLQEGYPFIGNKTGNVEYSWDGGSTCKYSYK